MASFASRYSWTSDMDYPASVANLADLGKRAGCEVTPKSENVLEVRQGSRLMMRMFGAWFLPLRGLPKSAIITLTSVEPGTKIDMVVEDRFGFGYFDDRSQRRFQSSFDELAVKLGVPLRALRSNEQETTPRST